MPGLNVLSKVTGKELVDEKLAAAFYACNIPFAVLESKSFVDAMDAMKRAPIGYKLPDRHRLSTDLLAQADVQLRSTHHHTKTPTP